MLIVTLRFSDTLLIRAGAYIAFGAVNPYNYFSHVFIGVSRREQHGTGKARKI